MDGVPAVDRDTANRIMLDRHQDTLTQRREDLQRQIRALVDDDTATVAQVERLRGQLHEVDTKLARLDLNERKLTSLGDRGLLLGIDPAGDGRVIISVGNPDTARHTAVWVPGLGTDLGSTDGNVNRVLNLQREADKATRGVDGDVATIMWLGYDAPETDGSVVTSTRSRQGAAALDSFVNGLRATHGGGDYHLTAVGHSYGSTVVAEAALGGEQPGNPRGLAVDDIVTAGSPGMHTSSASDLNIDAQHVWAGSAENDLVANFANVPAATVRYVSPLAAAGIEGIDMVHGASPHEPSFGANQYVVDTSGHSDYWEYDENGEATESLRNQAKVVAGRYDEVGLEHEASWE
ncbi:MAG: hypothetical protein HKP61_17825 [Dactylosporangium sp.]|nr:alpha/beta hydrolase family protein [Dactylosporangium sp.]NNJ62757.1 hypothetical protein [Dactylosporangium sp.]